MHPNQSTKASPRRKSPLLAGALSLLLPGLGQIYCQQDNKGIFLIGMSLLGHWATAGITSLVLFPAMAIDAFMIARKSNRGFPIARWEFFPAIKFLNTLPTRIILLLIVAFIATVTVLYVVHYAATYHPTD